jgi:head-tail adaptor
MVGAGDLRHRIAFEKRETVSDGYGNDEGDFAEQFIVSAALQARFGGETVTAARLTGQQPVTITVRQSSVTLQVTPDWRARDARSGTVYNIRSIADPDDGGAWLEMLCQSGTAT